MPRHSAQVDLIGQRFGRLTVVAKAESDRHGRRQWLCRCDCGEQVAVRENRLIKTTRSCGCAAGFQKGHDGKMRDFTGRRFGRYVVLGEAPRTHPRIRRVSCRCDCGTEKTVSVCGLVKGDSQSCGCASRTAIGDRARKHGLSRTPEYVAWVAMIQRCTNPRHPEFRRYGARGISVCPEWAASFEAFFRDMGHRPSPKHSIDRMDNDAGYSADNCRWTTQIIQMQDMRRNRYVTHDGVTLSVAEWARRLGVDRKVLGTRLYLGWPFEKAISTPVRERRKKPDAV